ncbi:unnamed protein product [Calypogeia fissa]
MVIEPAQRKVTSAKSLPAFLPKKSFKDLSLDGLHYIDSDGKACRYDSEIEHSLFEIMKIGLRGQSGKVGPDDEVLPQKKPFAANEGYWGCSISEEEIAELTGMGRNLHM